MALIQRPKPEPLPWITRDAVLAVCLLREDGLMRLPLEDQVTARVEALGPSHALVRFTHNGAVLELSRSTDRNAARNLRVFPTLEHAVREYEREQLWRRLLFLLPLAPPAHLTHGMIEAIIARVTTITPE